MVNLKDFLQLLTDSKINQPIFLHCINADTPDGTISDTENYAVVGFGKEKAKDCPFVVCDDWFYIEVNKIK